MVGVPKRCGGFVAIWLRAREEFADNRFQLLFIYYYRYNIYMCLCTTVNGPVGIRQTPQLQVAGDDHHECRLCFA